MLHITDITGRALPTLLVTLFLSLYADAQNHTIYSDRIATLQVVAGNDWQKPPIVKLNDRKGISISFDDLTHDYHRYTYSVTHCERDWSVSEGVFTSDYLSGLQDDKTIDAYEESINTNQLYNHYTLHIPNDECRITMSGNYRVDVIDYDTKDTMLTARFMVVEPIANASVQILTNTDIDIRRSHQQLDLRVDYPSSLTVHDPRTQFSVKVFQNNRIDDAVTCPPAPQLLNGSMRWTHCRDLIFDGGNEFHKFEFLDPHRNSLNVEEVRWDGETYHVHMYHDYPRPSYVYDEDANGAFYIRNSDNVDNEFTTDYFIAHFYLDCPRKLEGTVYVNGAWSINNLSEKYAMEYDENDHCYHAAIPLKMGYYSYQYLFIPDGSNEAKLCPTEGSFYQTENRYTVLTYFRGQLDRADRLVGAN